jgi:hypothetical protein
MGARGMSWKVTGSNPDFFFSIYVILPAALGPRVYSTSNKNEYQKKKKKKKKVKVSGE